MVMKTFHQQIKLHQAQLFPITVMPASVSAYTANVSVGIILVSAQERKDGHIGATTAQKSSDEASTTANTCRGDKHDPGTPDTDGGQIFYTSAEEESLSCHAG
jgi:hypothetical protein